MATAQGPPRSRPLALVTGGSRGLGRALTAELARRGWEVVIDGRDAAALAATAAQLGDTVTAIAGDIADPAHRRRLAEVIAPRGGLDLVVNNASLLGPSPQPRLADYPLAELERVYAVNTFAPLALLQLLLPHLVGHGGQVINISSDAAVEAYEGWGGYGSSKAALDHLTAVLAAEHPGMLVYAFDPGDMRTDMQQEAFPGEDISDRPAPESVVPALMGLIDRRPASGRYRAGDLAVATVRR
ncbi:MAG: SDR family NAD(P)-dependent oxidoreductase [Candidatus Dormibacteria bacterium]